MNFFFNTNWSSFQTNCAMLATAGMTALGSKRAVICLTKNTYIIRLAYELAIESCKPEARMHKQARLLRPPSPVGARLLRRGPAGCVSTLDCP